MKKDQTALPTRQALTHILNLPTGLQAHTKTRISCSARIWQNTQSNVLLLQMPPAQLLLQILKKVKEKKMKQRYLYSALAQQLSNKQLSLIWVRTFLRTQHFHVQWEAFFTCYMAVTRLWDALFLPQECVAILQKLPTRKLDFWHYLST